MNIFNRIVNHSLPQETRINFLVCTPALLNAPICIALKLFDMHSSSIGIALKGVPDDAIWRVVLILVTHNF